MASSKEYMNFILEQLAPLKDVTARSMMGEYIIYYHGKIISYLCDNRLLVKPVQSAIDYMGQANYELPYEGGKPMLRVDEVDSSEYLCGLFNAMVDELPEPKPKKKKNSKT